MSSDTVISVEHLSKRYRLGQIGATTLRESAERFWHRLRGRDPEECMGVVGERALTEAQRARRGDSTGRAGRTESDGHADADGRGPSMPEDGRKLSKRVSEASEPSSGEGRSA
ncbi:MAG: hypothetical protein R6V03_06110, partial [Kiritimatiellia bacterium]